jgi:stearoyl-CoA desaturase (delta-9 desaturase)
LTRQLGPADVQPSQNETLDRVVTGLVTIVPVLAVGFVSYLSVKGGVHWYDLAAFVVLYLVTGFGVTIGFHRYFTHRSFSTKRPIRALLAVLGSAAIEGPVISWVADHRKHHAFSDCEGDPHSPHAGHEEKRFRHLRGLAHAHLGWLFIHTDRASKKRYAPDLLNDPLIRFIDRTFFLWAAAGLAVPFGLGVVLGGSVSAGLTGLLWGGAIRMFVTHHVTYSINSLCHFFGRQRFNTGDESRNLAWLAPFSFGESWHNNHHAFPTSAMHGLRRLERLLDPSAAVISLLEKLGLAWDVVRVAPERLQAKAIPNPT